VRIGGGGVEGTNLLLDANRDLEETQHGYCCLRT